MSEERRPIQNGRPGNIIKVTGGYRGKPCEPGKIIPPKGGSGTAPPQGNKGKPK